MKVLELFSGIGGMHFALQKAIQDEEKVKVVAAIDINQIANKGWILSFIIFI